MTEKTATLYMATNKVNGKSYIGKTVRRIATRWVQHRCCARIGTRPTRFQAAIRQYGEDNFELKALVVGPAGEWMDDLEIRAIAAYDTFNNGYNDTKGGDGGLGSKGRVGKRHTPEARAKMSASSMGKLGTRLGHKNTPEQNEKLRQANLGKKASAETRAKLSALFKGRPGVPLSDAAKAKISAANKGRKHTEEWKAANSARMKGRKCTAEQIEKVRAALTGKAKSPEHCAKLSAALMGNVPVNKGVPHSHETKQKMKESWARRRAIIAAKDEISG